MMMSLMIKMIMHTYIYVSLIDLSSLWNKTVVKMALPGHKRYRGPNTSQKD